VNQTTIYGRVVRVIDGDTFRVRHCRSKWFCPKEEENPTGRRTRIYDSTLSLRIYGVDCPELQKKSSDPTSQPFAQEATDYTTKLVLGQVVAMKLLRKDQYGRAVAAVTTKQRTWMLVVRRKRDVSVELAQRGLATLYKGGGAEYNGNRDVLEAKIATAQKNKLGVWSLGNAMISPGAFKKQHGGGKPQYTSAKAY
jgi:endonuclease YncB( thermonuclease family)